MEKDNSYGWGMPFGDLMIRQLAPATPIMAGMAEIMGMGIIGAAAVGMLQEVRE